MKNSNRGQRGCFISFEGIDGCGKTTQINLLSGYLEQKNIPVLHIREPGGCAISEQIRKILLSNCHNEMTPHTELLLYWAARSQLIAQKISPALQDGRFVIADRFGWSTYAYQGYGRGMEIKHIDYLKNMICSHVWPEQSFYIDINPKLMRKRMSEDGKIPDRMESQNNDFFLRIRNGYLALAARKENHITVIDGEQAVEVIQEQIRSEVNGLVDIYSLKTKLTEG